MRARTAADQFKLAVWPENVRKETWPSDDVIARTRLCLAVYGWGSCRHLSDARYNWYKHGFEDASRGGRLTLLLVATSGAVLMVQREE